MPERLFLRLTSNGDLCWLRQTADGRFPAQSQSGKPPAHAIATSAQIVVFVPSEDVLLLETRVAARNATQRRQAVPFAIEDQLLGAVEEQHFAISSGAADQVGVAVVARSRMREWMAILDAAGIRADVVLPESLAVPFDDNTVHVLLDGARAVVRLAAWSAFSCPRADLAQWLESAREIVGSRRIETRSDETSSDSGFDALGFLARHWDTNSLNLLNGEFAAGHRQARGTRWWRRAMALAAAVLVFAFAGRVLEVSQLERQANRLDTAMADSLLRTFPDLGAAERTRAPQTVMRDRLERLRGGSETTGLLRLLGQIAPALGTTTRLQTRGMEYRNGILEIGLRAPDVATLDSMRERIAAIPGLVAEVTAANPVEAGVDGRIRISGAAP